MTFTKAMTGHYIRAGAFVVAGGAAHTADQIAVTSMETSVALTDVIATVRVLVVMTRAAILTRHAVTWVP